MSEAAVPEAVPAGRRPLLHRAEDYAIAVVLVAMVLIPLLESALRASFGIGISGAAAVEQHLTLFVGMLGAAIAARERRLLSLSTTTFLKDRWKTVAEVFASGFSAAISAFLAVASMQFALSEREGGGTLVYGIPTWIVQLILPLGFAAVTIRLLIHATENRRGRIVAVIIALIAVGAAIWLPIPPQSMLWPALILLLIAVALGAPVFAALGGAALILFWAADMPIAIVPLNHYSLVTNPTLPTIPIFTLAGYVLAESGASTRLVRVFMALFGSIRGGPAIVTALICAFFTTFTGASGVTILALGGLLMPVLLSARYTERDSLGLLTGAGSLGLLFPPSLPLILYAIVAEITMREMFLGGILPGFVMVALTAWWGIRKGSREVAIERRFNLAEARTALWAAKWELLLPVVAVVALFSGIATPVEAAAVTALYAIIIEVLIHREYRTFESFSRVVVECGLLIGGVLLILGVALGFTNYMIDAEVPPRLVEWTTASISSPWVFLLALNVFLLLVGCLMDIFSAIVVVLPLIVPIGQAFGINPVHLGIIFLANLQLGYLTPPVGMNLFLASYRFNKPLPEVYRAAFPMFLVLLIGVLLITYVPWLTTWLPTTFPGE